MPRSCQICNNPNRLAIDRAIAEGKSKSLIGREYGVNPDSIGYHAQHHLSRQLVSAYEKKGLAESMDLLARIDKIISRAEKIFKRNYDRDTATGDLTALKALSEQRCTIELLAKISAYLHEARVLELQNSQDHFQAEQAALRQEGMARLTYEEVEALYYIQAKMAGDLEGVEVPEIFKATISPPPVPTHQPPPLPRVKTAPTTVSTPVYGDDSPDPGLEQGEPETEPEQEPEPDKPRGLPPLPVKEIPGVGPGLRLQRHLLGRKIMAGSPVAGSPGPGRPNWEGALFFPGGGEEVE